jgi:hypothetical protein
MQFATSRPTSPLKILNRYLGTQTIWYWQHHIVCDNFWNRLIRYSLLVRCGDNLKYWVTLSRTDGKATALWPGPEGQGFYIRLKKDWIY